MSTGCGGWETRPRLETGESQKSARVGACRRDWGRPAYTKTAANNVFFWDWQAVNGLNLDTGQTTYMWWMCYRSWRDNLL